MKYNLNHIVLSRILNNFPSNAILFFLCLNIFDKPHSGTIRLGPCILLQKNYHFFVKSTYGSNGLFFYFEIFLTHANHGQYGLARILHFNQFLSKTDIVRFELYLEKSSVNSYQETIPFERSCRFKDSQ